MLKRLFGIGKKQETPPPPAAVVRPALLYDKPATPYENYFNLHLYRVSVAEVVAQIHEHYLHHVAAGTPAARVVASGDWVTVYFPEGVVKGLGFNRIASQVARSLETWVIGYRIFAWQGMDVHYFHGASHVEQLAYTKNQIEFEPDTPALFAPITDVSSVVPRRPDQHPLDFHFALLAALGIANAATTWDAVQALEGDLIYAAETT
jgi:hypothetical protein